MGLTCRIFTMLALIMFGAGLARASTYPNRPINIVVPYPAGGAADVMMRAIGKRMGEEFKQSVVVQNRPGGNGMIGARYVASEKPDGYTLVLVTDGMYSIAPWLLPRGQPDPMTELVPIIQLSDNPLAIVARPGLGVHNLKQLIELAKREPNVLTFAANSSTSTHFVAMQILMKQAGIKMRHVPYTGSAQAVPDLVGGRIDLMVASPTAVAPIVASGKGVAYLAVTSKTRFEPIADVPPVADTLPGYNQPAAMGLSTTKGAPPGVIAFLNKTIQRILFEPDIKKTIVDVGGGIPVGGSPEAFGQLIEQQHAARGPLLKELGLIGKK